MSLAIQSLNIHGFAYFIYGPGEQQGVEKFTLH